MNATSDAELARLLQLEFDQETASNIADIQPVSSNDRRSSGTKPIGIVDERWELIDPIPDIRGLFLQYNDQFFWGRLAGVEVKWSPRMTLCAGLCCYEGYGGLCSIRLSQPLLKLRPRKDLVETLLHEMIHAYLFVTQNNKDHDGHGPEFCKHMNRINSATGTNISIYHTFHDEVDLYRQHWWRCDGPCRQRKPYFGYVKRSMNRAPSARDPWWGEHQRSCGGTYTKIKEPEGYGQKKGGKKKGQEGEEDGMKESNESKGKPEKQGADIRNFIPFSGKGKIVGKPASASSSSSNPSPLSGIPHSNSSTSSTLSTATSDKSGSHSKERTRSLDSKDISSFFTKKGSSQPVIPSNSSANKSIPSNSANKSSSLGSNVKKKPQFTPVVATASGRVVVDSVDSEPALKRNWKPDDGVKPNEPNSNIPKKPRFTPVVATASGRVVVDPKESGFPLKRTSNPDDLAESKEPDSNVTSKKRFTPVVAAVGRKDGSYAISKSTESSSSSKDTSRENNRERNIDNATSSSGKTPEDNGDGKIKLSSVGNKKKRARLVDLQSMFDSDSDEDEEALSRLSKYPRYSHDNSGEGDSAIVVEDRAFGTTGAGSNNSMDIYIHGNSDDDDDEDDAVIIATSNVITSGIWKDLNHLSFGSSGSNGNRRFGRVSPPLWGKSKRKTNRGNEVGQTPPRSSFCEHPWETAARESDKKTSAAVSRVTGGVVNLTDDDDVGPKTVPCPVCNLQIEERKINTHLDTCLTYNCDALFS